MGQVAKDRQEFIEVWSDEFRQLRKLAYSMSSKDQDSFLKKLVEMQGYVTKAADFTYPVNVPTLAVEEVITPYGKRKCVRCIRVVYGAENTEMTCREYQIYVGSPVGTAEEILKTCKDNISLFNLEDVDGLLLCERDGETHYVPLFPSDDEFGITKL